MFMHHRPVHCRERSTEEAWARYGGKHMLAIRHREQGEALQGPWGGGELD